LIPRILRNREEAEDVLQEVFLAAGRAPETYKASLGTPAAWLVRIARNRAIDRLREPLAPRAIEEGVLGAGRTRRRPRPRRNATSRGRRCCPPSNGR
jgi:RNA polymerase sigma factor (sigma-70 family)